MLPAPPVPERSPVSPPKRLIRWVLLVLLAQQAVMNLISVVSGIDINFGYRMTFQHDFRLVYMAAEQMSKGLNPYDLGHVTPYVAPPPMAWLTQAVTGLDWLIAGKMFMAVNILAVLGAMLLARRLFGPGGAGLELVALPLFYPPFLFLVERGNLDGLVLLLSMAGAICLPQQVRAGVFFGLAAAVKLYPLALAGVLIVRRLWLALGGMALAILVAILVTPNWEQFWAMTMSRGSLFWSGDNVSIFRFPIQALTWIVEGQPAQHLLGPEIQASAAARAGIGAGVAWLALTLTGCLIGEIRQWRRLAADTTASAAAVLLYLPFLIAAPLLTVRYGLVLLLPLVPLAAWAAGKGLPRPLRLLFVAAFGATATASFMTSLAPLAIFGWLPSMGLAALLAWSALTRYWLAGLSAVAPRAVPAWAPGRWLGAGRARTSERAVGAG